MKPIGTCETRLRITGPDGVREIPLDGSGTTLGRGHNCDVRLNHATVSYRHARLSRDPFDRWIVEDLGSQNGITVGGRAITVQAIFPSETFHIRPFALDIVEGASGSSSPNRARLATDDEIGDAPVHYRRTDQDLSPAMVANLNELTAALLELSDPAQLYVHACKKLAAMFPMFAAVVRLPAASQSEPRSPHIVACHFGSIEPGSGLPDGSAIHLSRRVLEAARSTDLPVKATSTALDRANIGLTVIDMHRPHAVFSVCVSSADKTVDVLYLDVEQSQAPAGMFDFVEAIARQINFAQKNLLLSELQKQQETLQKKDRIKDQYVARVTHDIKGHLTAIQSCLHVVGFEKHALRERQLEFLQRAQNRTSQVADFVQELLELTRMQLNDEFRVSSFSLRGAIARALKAAKDCAREKSITLTSRIDDTIDRIVGNEFSITEMLHNLLFNAVKYTPEDKTVHVSVTHRGGLIQIDVCDTGIGIPAEDVPHVFDEFFRATNAKAVERDGSGLGLAIVRQIVQRHGGQVSVVSELEKGTTLTVLLPVLGPAERDRAGEVLSSNEFDSGDEL